MKNLEQDIIDMYKVIVYYKPEETNDITITGDGNVEKLLEYVKNKLSKNKQIQITLNSEVLFVATRLLVTRNILDHSDILISYKDNFVTIDKYAYFEEYPDKMAFEYGNICDEIIDYAMNMKKEKTKCQMNGKDMCV